MLFWQTEAKVEFKASLLTGNHLAEVRKLTSWNGKKGKTCKENVLEYISVNEQKDFLLLK